MATARRWRKGAVWAVAAAIAAAGGAQLGSAAPAALNGPVTIGGGLTYAWHADPSRGCTTQGLCGERGSTTVRFDGFGNLFAQGRGGAGLSLGLASATARVLREDPGAQPAECVDEVSTLGFDLVIRRVTGGGYYALPQSRFGTDSRCAGPVTADLASVRLPARRLPGRLPGFDLSGHMPFASGPFTGELISTMVIRPDLADRGTAIAFSTSFNSAGGPPPPPPRRRVLVEYVNLRYRVTGAGGALTTSFAGDPAPFCLALDACGVAGSVTVSVPAYRAAVPVSAERVVAHGVSPAQALSDLRTGRLVANGPFSGPSAVPAQVSETVTRSGLQACQDSRTVRVSVWLNGGPVFTPRPHAIPIVITSAGFDPLRTHCPGPTIGDIIGGGGQFGPLPETEPLAQGSILQGALGSRRIAVSLQHPGTFAGAGYTGARAGALQFTLTLVAAHAGTRSEVRQGG